MTDLTAIEKRLLAALGRGLDPNNRFAADIRTLINEVKERDTALEIAKSDVAQALSEWSVLETEVKELREENARLRGVVLEVQRHRIVPESEVLEEAHVRIAQMEEALREGRRSAFAIAEMADGKGQVFLKRMADGLCDQIDHHVAALSPSDTEEPRSWGIGSWRCPNCGEVNISEKCSECEFPRPSDTEEETGRDDFYVTVDRETAARLREQGIRTVEE